MSGKSNRRTGSSVAVGLCLALGAFALLPEQTFAEAENLSIPMELAVDVPCANAGLGETVLLTGDLHILVSSTVNGNIVRTKFHYQPQGISGYGTISGNEYHATGVTQGQFRSALRNDQATISIVNTFRLIGRGGAENFSVHENTHLTVKANGDVNALVDNLKTDCK